MGIFHYVPHYFALHIDKNLKIWVFSFIKRNYHGCVDG